MHTRSVAFLPSAKLIDFFSPPPPLFLNKPNPDQPGGRINSHKFEEEERKKRNGRKDFISPGSFTTVVVGLSGRGGWFIEVTKVESLIEGAEKSREGTGGGITRDAEPLDPLGLIEAMGVGGWGHNHRLWRRYAKDVHRWTEGTRSRCVIYAGRFPDTRRLSYAL